MILFIQALQMGNVMGRILDKDIEIRTPEEYYPYFFAPENKTETYFTEQEGDKTKLSREMELHKARMDDFIFRHNMAFQERQVNERGENSGGNDTGKTPSDHRGPDKGISRGVAKSTETDAEND